MEVLLHGGPWHGRRLAVPDKADHIHIVGPAGPPQDLGVTEAGEDIQMIPLLEGTYSQITGLPGNFEWDGWRSQ